MSQTGIAVKFLSVQSRQILFTYTIASRSILMSIDVRQRITNSAQENRRKESQRCTVEWGERRTHRIAERLDVQRDGRRTAQD